MVAFRGQGSGSEESRGDENGNGGRGSGSPPRPSPGSTGCSVGIDAYPFEGVVDPATLHPAVRDYYLQVQNIREQTRQRRNAHSSGTAPPAQGDGEDGDEHETAH